MLLVLKNTHVRQECNSWRGYNCLFKKTQFEHVQLAPAHVRREYNTWADGLGKGKTSAFSKDMRLRPELNPPEWLLLNSLIALGEL